LHCNLFKYRLRQTGINFYEHDFPLFVKRCLCVLLI
jgi:hypothetical protein